MHSLKTKQIPPILWQTNFTNKVTLAIYVNYLFNRLMSPTFEYRLHLDDDCDAYIAKHFPGEIYECYKSLQIGVAKADLWRVLVLEREGGIYIDLDANLSWFAERFITSDQQDLFIDKGTEITNYFLACAPGNLAMTAIRNDIIQNIKENTLTSIYDMTGPTVVDKIVRCNDVTVRPYRQIATQGQFTNKFFQYADKENGIWSSEQQRISIVKPIE